jgi:hypothetical protein
MKGNPRKEGEGLTIGRSLEIRRQGRRAGRSKVRAPKAEV